MDREVLCYSPWAGKLDTAEQLTYIYTCENGIRERACVFMETLIVHLKRTQHCQSDLLNEEF